MHPKVGILYLTYPTGNWEKDIPRAMEHLERINYPLDRIELICIESKGKKAPVKAWFEEHWMSKSGTTLPPITYIFRDEWIGFAGNNNLGLEAAREKGCDYVYLLNEDTDTDPDFLLKAVERAEADPKIAIVQSMIRLGEERERINTVGNAWHILGLGYSLGYRWTLDEAAKWVERERVTNPDLEIAYASGAGELVRVSALDQIGGLFDEAFFMYHEDTDLSLRARIQGWKVVLEPSSIIYHYYEFAKAKINYYWMERNRYALVFMYYRWWTLLLLAPLFVVLEVAMWVFAILRGWSDMKWKAFREFFTAKYWIWVQEKRQLIQAKRQVADGIFLQRSTPEILFQEEAVKNVILDRVGNPVMRWYWQVVRRFI